MNVALNNRSIFGQSDVQISHADLLAFETVLAIKPLPIVELGTGTGVTSMYLGTAAAINNVLMMSFDITDRRLPGVKAAWLNNMSFFRQDIFEDHHRIIADLLSRYPVLLFCDNGNKPKEFQTFVPHLLPGSIVIVHDWLHEIFHLDVEKTVETCNLTPIELPSESWMAAWIK